MEVLTKYAVKDFLNALQLGSKIDRQLDKTNVFSGKTGATAKIRRPLQFDTSEGAEITTGQITDIEEGTITMTLNERHKTVIAIKSQDMTLNVDRLRELYIQPQMVQLAQVVETKIAQQYKYLPNFIGTPGTSPSTFLDVGAAYAKLLSLGVPDDGRLMGFYGPNESLTLANGMKAVFPNDISKKAIENAKIGRYANISLYNNQSLAMHTVGVNTGTPLVKLAAQNVTYATAKDTWTQTLNTQGWTASQTGILKAGDVFTLALVYAVNRRTKQSTGDLQQFVVTADANSDISGDSTLTISPPIITSGPYQTVTVAPANNAPITVQTDVPGTGGTVHRQNLILHPDAITMAMVPLELPEGGVMATRVDYENISIRMVKQYDISLDQTIWRCDILFGLKAQNPEWAVRATS